MQTGIHYTKDKQKVRILSVDEENKIAYIDYLNGQKKWVNEKEYETFAFNDIYVIAEMIVDDLPSETFDSIKNVGIINNEGEIENVKPIKNKRKNDTANKK